jgi:hypothetical protein
MNVNWPKLFWKKKYEWHSFFSVYF